MIHNDKPYNNKSNSNTERIYNNKHLNKKAFDLGFKDFQRGNFFNNPFLSDDISHKEWQRGQDAAYKMYLDRNKTRELYKRSMYYDSKYNDFLTGI